MKTKQPYGFDLVNGKMLGFAGLWNAWKDPANGKWLQSYTIITTEANEVMAAVHSCMPVILHPASSTTACKSAIQASGPVLCDE